MYGIAAITAKNGWAMALTGALIVMAGLAALALVISQLQKLAALIENRGKDPSLSDVTPPAEEKIPSFDLHEVKQRYPLMAQQLGESFELARLYQLANDSGFPHVHLSIRSLREAGYLIPAGAGMFTWQK